MHTISEPKEMEHKSECKVNTSLPKYLENNVKTKCDIFTWFLSANLSPIHSPPWTQGLLHKVLFLQMWRPASALLINVSGDNWNFISVTSKGCKNTSGHSYPSFPPLHTLQSCYRTTRQETHSLEGPMQSSWQKAPHPLHMIMAFNRQ